MPELKLPSKLEQILGRDDADKAFTTERQPSAQSFAINLETAGGREAEQVGWSHYYRSRWRDSGEMETLSLLFGEDVLIEIEGFNLRPLVSEIRECRLSGISEMSSAEVRLRRASGTSDPIIAAVRAYPEFDEIIRRIKGARHGKSGHAGRI